MSGREGYDPSGFIVSAIIMMVVLGAACIALAVLLAMEVCG